MTAWKDISDFPGYQVSSTGDVRSFQKTSNKPKTLSQTPVGNGGHLRVFLYKDKKRYPLLVHRVVAQTFIPNPDNYPVVRHKDDNPSNNNVNNLIWGTQRDNMHDCIRNNGINYDGIMQYNERRKTPVLAYNTRTGETELFDSQNNAARLLGVTQGNLWKSLKTGVPTKGYVFTYVKRGDNDE